MRREQNPWLPVLRALTLVGLGGVWAVACGGPQELTGAGAVCFRADDCQAGLACVPVAGGSSERKCSADLSGIVSLGDGGPQEAAAPLSDASGGASGAAMIYAGAGGTPGGGTGSGGKPSAGGSGGKPSTGGAAAGGTSSAGSSSTAGTSPGGSSSAGKGGAEPTDAGDG